MSESGSQLRGGRGNTTVSDTVVAKVAGVAAQEVEKVQMGGGATAAVGGFLGAEEAAVDLTLAIEYGAQIPQTAQAVRRNVINRVENLTGLRVTEVNITVTDVPVPEERPMLGRQQQVEQQARQQEQQA
jgi:uncharacterized alkaline shock family protein YloU